MPLVPPVTSTIRPCCEGMSWVFQSGFGDSRLAASAATAVASATPATRVRPSFIKEWAAWALPDARVLVLLHMAVSSGCPGVTGWSTDSVSAGGYPVIIQANMDG